MKRCLSIFSTAIVFGAVIGSSGVYAGGDISGGGDDLASYLDGVARRTATTLQILCDSPTVAKKRFQTCQRARKIVKQVSLPVKVLTKDRVYLRDGTERSAINNLRDTITYGSERYRELMKEQDAIPKLLSLILHEYLGTAKAEASDQYNNSADLLRFLKDYYIDLNALVGTPPVLASAEQLERLKKKVTDLSDDELWTLAESGLFGCRVGSVSFTYQTSSFYLLRPGETYEKDVAVVEGRLFGSQKTILQKLRTEIRLGKCQPTARDVTNMKAMLEEADPCPETAGTDAKQSKANAGESQCPSKKAVPARPEKTVSEEKVPEPSAPSKGSAKPVN